jgi:hypothetical protein
MANSAAFARGIHGGSLMAPANPSVPPTLSPDPRLVGSAPLPPHAQPTRRDDPSTIRDLAPTAPESGLDRRLSICQGC